MTGSTTGNSRQDALRVGSGRPSERIRHSTAGTARADLAVFYFLIGINGLYYAHITDLMQRCHIALFILIPFVFFVISQVLFFPPRSGWSVLAALGIGVVVAVAARSLKINPLPLVFFLALDALIGAAALGGVALSSSDRPFFILEHAPQVHIDQRGSVTQSVYGPGGMSRSREKTFTVYPMYSKEGETARYWVSCAFDQLACDNLVTGNHPFIYDVRANTSERRGYLDTVRVSSAAFTLLLPSETDIIFVRPSNALLRDTFFSGWGFYLVFHGIFLAAALYVGTQTDSRKVLK